MNQMIIQKALNIRSIENRQDDQKNENDKESDAKEEKEEEEKEEEEKEKEEQKQLKILKPSIDAEAGWKKKAGKLRQGYKKNTTLQMKTDWF
jgi:hypothetical protein